jgi:hypothetical protein
MDELSAYHERLGLWVPYDDPLAKRWPAARNVYSTILTPGGGVDQVFEWGNLAARREEWMAEARTRVGVRPPRPSRAPMGGRHHGPLKPRQVATRYALTPARDRGGPARVWRAGQPPGVGSLNRSVLYRRSGRGLDRFLAPRISSRAPRPARRGRLGGIARPRRGNIVAGRGQ